MRGRTLSAWEWAEYLDCGSGPGKACGQSRLCLRAFGKPRPSVPLEAELLLVDVEVAGVGLDGVDHLFGIARPMISTAPSPTMPDRRLPEIICSSFISTRGISQLPSAVLTEVFGKPAGPPNDRPPAQC